MNNNSPYYKKKADLLWGKYLHMTKRACLVCGKMNIQLEAHDLITRSNVLTRNDPDNGVILCIDHHRLNVKCSPHKGPKGFKKFLKKNYPDKSEYIKKNRYRTGKPDFKADCEYLQELIDNFNGEN